MYSYNNLYNMYMFSFKIKCIENWFNVFSKNILYICTMYNNYWETVLLIGQFNV